MEQQHRSTAVKWLLVGVPIWLLVSGSLGLWAHFHFQEKERQLQEHAYRKDVSAVSLADDFSKIAQGIGPRHHTSEAGRTGLQSMASMIEGGMGPSNIGYEVKKLAGIESAGITVPLLTADVLRRKTDEEIWLIVPYDSPAALPRGAASASSLAVSFAVAQSLIGQPLERNIRFLFVPMVYADEQERMDMAARVQRLIVASEGAVQVVVMGSMLHRGAMVALTRDVRQPLVRDAGGLVSVSEDAEICLQGDGEFSSLLYEMNLPAALLMKRPEGEMSASAEDGIMAPASVLAQSAEQMTQVLRRMATSAQKK